MSKGFEVTIKAPINIALIKYWGKRNEELMLPMNDSISISIDQLCAITKISIGPHIKEDAVSVNGQILDQKCMARFRRVFQEVAKFIGRKRNANGEQLFRFWHINVDSNTNFPTSAGLASSAAGFAAIAFGIGQIFHLNERDIIRLARMGSGSACRSILGGFVHWKAGTDAHDDSDCTCETIVPILHWPELRALIFVVSQSRKKLGSSEAMRKTAKTSELIKTRVEELVPKRVANLREAILGKNFVKLAEITMAESNQLHALCLDTSPPIHYLETTSYALMEFVHHFNAHFGIRLAYTFDAGPNCCLFFEQSTLPLLYTAFKRCFTFDCQFPEITDGDKQMTDADDRSSAEADGFPWPKPRQIHLERIIFSKVGTGPRLLDCTSSASGIQKGEGSGAKKQQQSEPGGTISVDCKML